MSTERERRKRERERDSRLLHSDVKRMEAFSEGGSARGGEDF